MVADDAPVLWLAIGDDTSVEEGDRTSVDESALQLGMPHSWGFGLDLSLPAGGLAHVGQARGRSRARSASPGATRRRSRAARTPPSTPDPPSSPTSVILSPLSPKGNAQVCVLLAGGNGSATPLLLSPSSSVSEGARMALALLTSASLVVPERPPGFEATPEPRTPPLALVGSPARTPQPVRVTMVAAAGAPLAPLFTRVQEPLLSPPMSSPPVRPANRRKTMAGVDIARTGGFSLRRTSERIKARRKAAPVAKKAEAFVCAGLGIVKDGEVVTEQAMKEFARRFKGRVPKDVLGVMRALFKIGDEEDDELDAALLGLGGADALDLDQASIAADASCSFSRSKVAC
ncbi:hypothetical protein ACQ4PT_051995 [Festuca glaucescens]